MGMSHNSNVVVRPAVSREDLNDFRDLTKEYQAALGVDLTFQGINSELEGLPGKYAAPSGIILLAFVEGKIAGGVAVRQLPETASSPVICATACEMKRLFVRPAYRSLGLGMTLGEASLVAARRMGYTEMYLDTLERLGAANKLYQRLGFHTCESYNGNPLTDVVFWVKELKA